MRYLVVILAASLLAACSTPPVTRSKSPSVSSLQDPAIQFLLTAAATDFHKHGPSVVGFRDVRFGYVVTSSGEKQFRLCGQFLQSQEEKGAEWMPFVTIKTGDYEQWIGGQAEPFCQDSLIVWVDAGDLSSALQSRLDSLRKGTK